jgi:hypothetical protein
MERKERKVGWIKRERSGMGEGENTGSTQDLKQFEKGNRR